MSSEGRKDLSTEPGAAALRWQESARTWRGQDWRGSPRPQEQVGLAAPGTGIKDRQLS